MKHVFGFSSDGYIKEIKSSYKKITGKEFNVEIKKDKYQGIVTQKNSFLTLQDEIKSAFDKREWDSYNKKDGELKDKKYIKLKKSLDDLNKKYEDLKNEGGKTREKWENEILKLYTKTKVFDDLGMKENAQIANEELLKKKKM